MIQTTEQELPSVAVSPTAALPYRNSVSKESMWKTTEAVPLTRESFLDLLYGRTPLIGVPQFISRDLSQRTLEYLLPKFSPYLHATGPSVEKVGLAQFEFQAQSVEDIMNRTGEGR